MRETLIYHKKRMYYLLSNMDEKYILESERGLLTLLQDDIELMAELVIKEYMKGE